MPLNGWIYCLHDTDNDICRIGQTSDFTLHRIKSQVKYYPFNIRWDIIPVDNIDLSEKYFHEFFKDRKISRGSDWFKITLDDFKKECDVHRVSVKMLKDADFYNQSTFIDKVKEISDDIRLTTHNS